MPVKSKVNKEDDEDVGLPKSAKKQKTVKKVTMEDEHEEVNDEDEHEEESEEVLKKKKDALRRKRKKAKNVGYRSLAKTAGYNPVTTDEPTLPSGVDCMTSLISLAESKRLMRYTPATPGAPGFDSDEFTKRMDLYKQSVPDSAARITQVYADAILRLAMDDAVLIAVESGKKVITASMMQSVLRKYASMAEFTCVNLPLGVLRHAQNNGVLTFPESDSAKAKDEKKAIDSNKKMFNEFTEAEEKRKQLVRDAKKQKSSDVAKHAMEAEAEVNAD